MLEACSCSLDAAEPASDFERLNNAIIRAASKGGAFGLLNSDWQDEVVDERSWKMALPPVWSSLLQTYWKRYADLYLAAGDKNLANPYDVAPTGVSGALKDLYRPVVQVAEQVKRDVEKTAAETTAILKAKTQEALRAAGKSMAEGAAEETKKQTINWGAWAAGVAALGFGGYLALRGRRA